MKGILVITTIVGLLVTVILFSKKLAKEQYEVMFHEEVYGE